MDLLQALVVGVLQGLTEFLPISSTAHLRVVPVLLWGQDPGAAVTAVIQIGTVLAVLVYFARDLGRIAVATLRAIWQRDCRSTLEARLGYYIILGSLPIVILGVASKHLVEGRLRSLWVVTAAAVLFAVLLWLAERLARHHRSLEALGLRDALIIGGAQALALIPGASRSGTTLTAALCCGLRREDAARYSFLLSVPAVLGAGLFELRDALRGGLAEGGLGQGGLGHGGLGHGNGSLAPLLLATAVAFVVGYASIAWLLRFLRTRSTMVFVVYRLLLGVVLVALLLAGKVGAGG